MMRRTWFVAGVITGFLLTVGLAAHAALGGASGVMIPYRGHLELDGAPVNGPVDFSFQLFDQDGAVCSQTYAASADLVGGDFGTVFGPVAESCVVGKQVFVEVTVTQNGQTVKLDGRQRLYPTLAALTSGPGDFTVSGRLKVADGAEITGTLQLTGMATVGDLKANGNVDIAGRLKAYSSVFLGGGLSNEQGTHIMWNRIPGSGATSIINHRGLGGGGFYFGSTADGVNVTNMLWVGSDGWAQAANGFRGPFAGDVTGDVTGNVSGNVSGNINGVRLGVKTGNNGTTNCDYFCLAGYEGWTGACVGIRYAGIYSSDCGAILNQATQCLCASW